MLTPGRQSEAQARSQDPWRWAGLGWGLGRAFYSSSPVPIKAQPGSEPRLQGQKALWAGAGGWMESGQGKKILGMSHPENVRDPCLWSPLGLGLPFWEVGTYPRDMARLLAGREMDGGH